MFAKAMRLLPFLALSALLPCRAEALDADALFAKMKTNARLDVLRESLVGDSSTREQKKQEHATRSAISKEENRLRGLVSDCKAFVRKGKMLDVRARDRQKRTLLMLVAASGCDAAVEMVLAETPELDARDAKQLCAADYERDGGGNALGKHLKKMLRRAVEERDMETIALLFDSGVSTNEIVDGEPVLALAIRQGNEVLSTLLLANGASVSGLTKERYSMLELAARMDRPGIVEALIRAGANTERPFANGITPEFYMAAVASDACFGAFARASRTSDRALLQTLAARSGTAGKIREVVNAPNKEDAQGNIPLHEAARRGDVAIFRLLLELGGKRQTANKRGETTLMHAAYSGNPELVKVALEGLDAAECSRKDKKGASAADYAKRSGNKAVQKLILEAAE